MKLGKVIRNASFLLLSAGLVFAQQRDFGGGRQRRNVSLDTSVDRNGTPTWENPTGFKKDVFTFARVQYGSNGGRRTSWLTDFPDSDLNLSFRLQQMTSLKVDPNGVIVELTDPKLFDYPFIYMLEVGSLEFTEEEAKALRTYLDRGGFLMVDDFWGRAWDRFQLEMDKIYPKENRKELDMSHPIFHCVFDLKGETMPQVPGINWARNTMADGNLSSSENDSGPAHYYAYYDDKGRMVAIICHNTDLGDGWEREGEEEWYFHQFSEKLAYPVGINIVYYAMTH